jgi:hypothetical protein
MSCTHCNDLVYTYSTGSDIHRLRAITKAELISSANIGCIPCRFILEGTTSVVGSNFERVEIQQFVLKKDGEERHTYPLVVRAQLAENHIEEVEFYADDCKLC